jgi:hypothetical protein
MKQSEGILLPERELRQQKNKTTESHPKRIPYPNCRTQQQK